MTTQLHNNAEYITKLGEAIDKVLNSVVDKKVKLKALEALQDPRLHISYEQEVESYDGKKIEFEKADNTTNHTYYGDTQHKPYPYNIT